MTGSEYLINRGWRHIGSKGFIKFWDHPNHQPDRRGAFTTSDALEHQQACDKDLRCNCINNTGETQ